MRVTTTIEGGPVATMLSDWANSAFSHMRWTNFSGLDMSNFESRLITGGQWQGNGLIGITDLP